jgi:hypothetical protein
VSKAEEFRAKAIECDKLADKAMDAEAKQMLREAAEEWRWLAALEERLSR